MPPPETGAGEADINLKDVYSQKLNLIKIGGSPSPSDFFVRKDTNDYIEKTKLKLEREYTDIQKSLKSIN